MSPVPAGSAAGPSPAASAAGTPVRFGLIRGPPSTGRRPHAGLLPDAAVAAAPVGGASSLPVPSNARCPTMIRRRRDVAAHCWGSDGARRWPARTFNVPARARPPEKWRNDAVHRRSEPAGRPQKYAPATFFRRGGTSGVIEGAGRGGIDGLAVGGGSGARPRSAPPAVRMVGRRLACRDAAGSRARHLTREIVT